MIETHIYGTFCTNVATFAGAQDPVLPVSFGGVHFTPPDSGCWLEVRHFPNEVENYGIADDGGEVRQGFFQVGVCHRSMGLILPMQIAGLIVENWRKGQLIGPARITRPPSPGSVIEFDDRRVLPVIIPYRVFTVTEPPSGGGGGGDDV